VRGQFVLTAPSDEWFDRTTWREDVAIGWRPHAEPGSPVRMSPELRLGKPSVAGVSTEVIWEHTDGDEDEHEIAEALDLNVANVRWALAYELPLRAV
jgi:uncharacterized protein (DUF433 family)